MDGDGGRLVLYGGGHLLERIDLLLHRAAERLGERALERVQIDAAALVPDDDVRSREVLGLALCGKPCATLETLLALSPEQVRALPPAARELVISLFRRLM